MNIRRMMFLFFIVPLIGGFLLSPGGVLAQDEPVQFTIESVNPGAVFPVAMAFTPDGRLFYTEKERGWVRMIDAEGKLQSQPVLELIVDSQVERGLLGIAVDPDFENNHYLWVYYTQPNNIEPPYAVNKIIRFREDNGIGSDIVEMYSSAVTTRHTHHHGGNIHFGPDGFLYVTIGDYGDDTNSQNRDVEPGKIHRFQVVDDTLVPAPGNPFTGSSIYAYGLRNSFDFDFHPDTGWLYASENGPACDDEINLIFPGGNYGWRAEYPCDDAAPSGPYVYPLIYFTPTEGLTGISIYDGEMFPEWYGDLFFCEWNKGVMWHMTLDESGTLMDKIERVNLPNHACATDVEVGPDGSIYFAGFTGIFRMVRVD